MPVIKRNQNMLDMTVQYTGSLENLFLMAVLNGRSITDYLTPGDSLVAAPVTEKRITDFFVSTAYDVTTIEKLPLPPGGIGYMKIGTSFKVS